MRLRRVEAVRYGALVDASLGDLAPGLTVVRGPNEAGKSSYTALVRHVLYGFPNLRDSEPGYHVQGGGRCARLVFEDEDGSWVIERTEGTHGGTVRIHATEGRDRPTLLEDLRRGVSGPTFRTVFGFGLDQMAAIEKEHGSEDGVIARLYAAGAGLRVNPQEVRAAIDREAAEIFKPAGRKQPVGEFASDLRAVRAEIRDLRAEADAFLEDQAHLHEMEQELEEARLLRDSARERMTELAVALERAEERRAEIAAQEVAQPGLLREHKQLREEAEELRVDEMLLAAAPEVEALLDEAAGHARALQSLAESEAVVLRAETREADSLARTGLPRDVVDALGDTHDVIDALDSAREDLQRLQMQCESRDEAVRRATAELARLKAEQARVLMSLGIDAEPSEAIAERLAAIDAVEAIRGGGPGVRGVDLPSFVLLVSGVIAVAAGLVLREWATVAIGAALTVAGAVLVLRSWRGGHALPDGEERAYLKLLGLDSSVGALELSRARRALEAARAADEAALAARRGVEEAQREASMGCDALEARQLLWSEWLAGHGLDTSLTPGAASALLMRVREARDHRALADEAKQSHTRLLGRLDTFAGQFGSVAGSFLGLPAAPVAAEVPALANRLKEKLADARTASARREEIARALTALDSRLTAEGERAARARRELLEVLERFDLADGGTHEDLRVLHAGAVHTADEAIAAHDALAQRMHQLEGRLETGIRDRRLGELHLTEAGLVERLADAVDRYLVLAIASRLLAEAQARYQRERQPDVVRRAGELFATMTAGRYVGLTFPLDGGSIEVFDSRSGVHTSDVLSRGTAEQLYLAVRLGLIAQLGEVGQGLPVLMDDVLVNFDPGRRHGAAEAIAELAAERQVIFFTCHPDTADLFAEVAPDAVRLELARLGV